jgi:thiamine pyrophosphate-dependent acetolactate synthase large subunit-like protein
VSVKDALGAMIELDRLYREALLPRQGAVWLDIPQDVATSEA